MVKAFELRCTQLRDKSCPPPCTWAARAAKELEASRSDINWDQQLEISLSVLGSELACNSKELVFVKSPPCIKFLKWKLKNQTQ